MAATSSTKECGKTHSCLVNLGLYRTGSTTLAEAARLLFGDDVVHRDFPDLEPAILRSLLWDPQLAVLKWWNENNGKEELLHLISQNRFIGDGWIPLLVFLPLAEVLEVVRRMPDIQVTFLATQRNIQDIVHSELHHWVRWELEKRCGLSEADRQDLQRALTNRAKAHQVALQDLNNLVVKLPLDAKLDLSWARILSSIPLQPSHDEWKQVLHQVGPKNTSPPLPLEAILLTLRIGATSKDAITRVMRLLDQVEADHLCKYMLVVALDDDEFDSSNAKDFCRALETRKGVHQILFLRNEPFDKVVPICKIWDAMAVAAWDKGASWVVFLGDDIDLKCSFHYRAIYRGFLDIQENLTNRDIPFFGCPWFDDQTFPGFPTFPVVGRAHYEIYGGLVPCHREFVNQDLDPYLQRLYLKFGAAPQLAQTKLVNTAGGCDAKPARYQRFPAPLWRNWVLEDTQPIETFLRQKQCIVTSKLLLDVIVPTFRINFGYLARICSLVVPDSMRTTFIVIVDNPDELLRMTKQNDLDMAAGILENWLRAETTDKTAGTCNNIRVRSNQINLGASASRNRGLDESAAEFVLFLDDDVIPSLDLLEQYKVSLDETIVQENGSDRNILGLVGLVRFPRDPNLPLKHAAALMSYLTFMFEIAENPIYADPAWGVTANILIRRLPQLRFDTGYAKTGGGEDVDFCLRLGAEHGGRLRSAPNASVIHHFWKGSIYELSMHFFNWAGGDSALFHRFPDHCYYSFPNLVETTVLVYVPIWLSVWRSTTWLFSLSTFAIPFGLMFAVDVIVDYRKSFAHRCLLLHYPRSFGFCVLAHCLANFYVVVLETGRLVGHSRRGHLSNIGKRFDWHCGRLPLAPKNFRCCEFYKFVGFLIVISLYAAISVSFSVDGGS